MIANNNKAAVKNVAVKMVQANRVRNVFAILAIILTTFMIATVFTVGMSTLDNYKLATVRYAGTAANISLSRPTEEQVETITSLGYVKGTGTQIDVGVASYKDKDKKDVKVRMYYSDPKDFELHLKPAISDIKGTYPKKEKEIMLSDFALRQLKISDPVIGMDVHLNYQSGGKEYKGDFVLSGYYKSYQRTSNSGAALLSKAFADKKGVSLRHDGSILISCQFQKQASIYEKLNTDVKIRKDQEFQAFFDVDSQASMAASTILVLVVIALFIVFSGYLLIYNIMYISITKDIRFYGLLKTIGTTPKQIKGIVRLQMRRLALIGIPTGLVLAAVSSFVVMPGILYAILDHTPDTTESSVSFSPLIFIGTALFSLITVVISSRKPGKTASKVSPVEAVKYTGIKGGNKKGIRKSRGGGKVFKMAFYNVFRDKKRAALVFASLFMGAITLLAANTFFGSLNPENYADRYVPNDFSYQCAERPEEETLQDSFPDSFVRKLSQVDGITAFKTVQADTAELKFDKALFAPVLRKGYDEYLAQSETGESYDDFVKQIEEAAENGGYGTTVYGIDDSYVKAYNKKNEDHPERQIDVAAFNRGETGVIGYESYETYKNLLGKELSLTSKTSKQHTRVKVDGVFDFEDIADVHLGGYSYFMGAPETVFVSKACMKKLNKEIGNRYLFINVDAEKEAYVSNQLAALNKELKGMDYTFQSKKEEMEGFMSSLKILNTMCASISVLLLLIGVMNFVNVMLTGVYTRKGEFAVMESLGASKKHIRKMLLFEGLYYAVFTLLLILTLGNAIILGLGSQVKVIADYAEFQYPFMVLGVLAAFIMAVCLTVPGIVYKMTSKNSIIERLHAAD